MHTGSPDASEAVKRVVNEHNRIALPCFAALRPALPWRLPVQLLKSPSVDSDQSGPRLSHSQVQPIKVLVSSQKAALRRHMVCTSPIAVHRPLRRNFQSQQMQMLMWSGLSAAVLPSGETARHHPAAAVHAALAWPPTRKLKPYPSGETARHHPAAAAVQVALGWLPTRKFKLQSSRQLLTEVVDLAKRGHDWFASVASLMTTRVPLRDLRLAGLGLSGRSRQAEASEL
mmetsp:Transcript_28177/g.80879  ORF Transcript_28177/g.80879 Transcript_28177/m.80879 type:complete len:229 (+) Transcript_28177:1755-2441(+)